MKRALSPIILSLFIVLLLASACGEEERLTLRLSSWSAPEEMRIMDECIARFEAKYPEVRVVHEVYTSGYLDKIMTTLAAGNPPDVIFLDSIHIPTFTNAEALVDLAPYVPRLGIDLKRFYPNVLAIAQQGDHLWAFPKDFTPLVYFYNKDLFDRTGTPYPEFDWTWADFLRTCKSLTTDEDGDGRLDTYGTELNRELFRWQPWLWNGGGDIFMPDAHTAVGAFDSPESIRTFEFLTRLVSEHKVTRRYEALKGMSRNYDQGQKMFYSGRIGLFPSGHWWLPKMLKYMEAGDLHIGVAPFPRYNEQSKPVTVMYESGLAVPKAGRHRKWAIRLAAFLADEESQRIRAMSGLAISAMPAVAKEIAASDKYGIEETFLRIVPFCRAPWGTRVTRFSKVEDVAPSIFDKILVQGKDVATAAHEVANEIEAVIAHDQQND